MNIIKITEIDFGEGRQRKYFSEAKIIDLAGSIEDVGLIHAPAMVKGSNLLVAGERRIRAIEMLHRLDKPVIYQGEPIPLGHVPITYLRANSPRALKEAELAENLIREDLTWQERVQAERELHQLRLEENPKQSIKATAEEIYGKEKLETNVVPQRNLSDNLFLAEHLGDPEIAKIKDRKQALRVAKEKVMAEKRKKLREDYDAPDKVESVHTLIHGSGPEELSKFSEIDLILTDPPYGMDAGEFGSQFTLAHNYEDSSETWADLMTWLARESFKATKSEAHAFVFCHILRWYELARIFETAGWSVWPRPLIWDKGSLGTLPRPEHGPRFCYESILFATKGDKKVLRTGRDVLSFPNPSKTFHAAEKPVDLYAELIGRTLEPGGLVADPFCGSGTIFPASTRQAVRAIGIEINEDHYLTARERLG